MQRGRSQTVKPTQMSLACGAAGLTPAWLEPPNGNRPLANRAVRLPSKDGTYVMRMHLQMEYESDARTQKMNTKTIPVQVPPRNLMATILYLKYFAKLEFQHVIPT